MATKTYSSEESRVPSQSKKMEIVGKITMRLALIYLSAVVATTTRTHGAYRSKSIQRTSADIGHITSVRIATPCRPNVQRERSPDVSFYCLMHCGHMYRAIYVNTGMRRRLSMLRVYNLLPERKLPERRQARYIARTINV